MTIFQHFPLFEAGWKCIQVSQSPFTEIDQKQTHLPESSKGLRFELLNHPKQTSGLKFDTLGGSRYMVSMIFLYVYFETWEN